MTASEVAQALRRWAISRPGHPSEMLWMSVDPDVGDEILIRLEDNGREVQRFRCTIEEIEA